FVFLFSQKYPQTSAHIFCYLGRYILRIYLLLHSFVFSCRPTYNDVFGFFVDGKNIALLPVTGTPVSISNVNGGDPLGTNAQNPVFYNNNDLSDGGPFFNIQYDGFTNVFTAQAKGLAAGRHKIKLAIADAGDSRYDSAVFIQAGTFSSTRKSVPEPASILSLLAFSAFGATSVLKGKQQNNTGAKA
ncbi:choice-of-anchor L domain-containing protein, partial [Nostoc sp. CHAB 5834]|nr:choice-of-anchor L domain-containing protein [Nostoc sp. CHAB 5834]